MSTLVVRLALLSLAVLIPIASSPAISKRDAALGAPLEHAESHSLPFALTCGGIPGGWLAGPSDANGCGDNEEQAKKAAKRDFEGKALVALTAAGQTCPGCNPPNSSFCQRKLEYDANALDEILAANLTQTPSGYCTNADGTDVQIRAYCTGC